MTAEEQVAADIAAQEATVLPFGIKCPKCTGRPTAPKYCRSLHKQTIHESTPLLWGYPLLSGKEAPEHLDRTCGRCGYSWLERCADTLKETP